MIPVSLYYINPEERNIAPELYDKCDDMMSFNIYSEDNLTYMGSIINQTNMIGGVYESEILHATLNDNITDKDLMKLLSFYLRNLRLRLITKKMNFYKVSFNKNDTIINRLYNLLKKRYDVVEIVSDNEETCSFELKKGNWE